MVQDHTTLQNDLKNWAAQNHVSLPTEASQTDISQKRKLEGLSGAAFDSAYMEDMLSDHKNDIAEVQKMAENASNPQVKQLAQKTLPLLEDHERVAENVAGQLQITSTKGLNQPEHPSGEASRSKRQ
jgi:putative membrane protein